MADKHISLSASNSQEHSSIPGEVWRPVPSEPGVMASSEGRIVLPPRYAPIAHGGFRGYFPKPRYGQVSREHKEAKHTYRIIMVRDETKQAVQRPRKVHQLVCEAFHGPKPFAAAVVLHLDEDAHNNRPENLKWGTQKENLNAPKLRASIRKRPIEAKCAQCAVSFEPEYAEQKFCSLRCVGESQSVLDDIGRRKVRDLLRGGRMQKDIARALGVSTSVIQRENQKMKEGRI